MTYKINDIKVAGETLNVDVTYTFADESTKTVTVANFMPKTKQEVLDNLEARGESEQAKIDAEALNESIKAEMLS